MRYPPPRAGDSEGRPTTDRPDTYNLDDDATVAPTTDITQGRGRKLCGGTADPGVIASRAYEAGFCDGWADRAEYERRTRPVEPLTFDDGLAVGRLLAAPPATGTAPRPRELTAEDLAQYEEMRRRTRKWLGWES